MRIALICLLGLCIAALTGTTAASDPSARIPILVELFTSEGCSDCPPADTFLQKLDQQPFSATEMIVLSEHVDYWNHDGWRDPYSSSLFTDRQATYCKGFSLQTAYTPQMVVDGESEFVGSNQTAASKAFARAVTQQRVDIRLTSISIAANRTVRAHLEAAALPTRTKPRFTR